MRALRIGLALASGLGLCATSVRAETASIRSAPWELRIAGGGEVSETRFGIFDLGLRKGPLSIQLFTDTLDVRYAKERSRGRWWIAARAETFAAGLMISPWTDGAPDPSRALTAAYLGAEGGGVAYLPGGLYAGGQAMARLYLFFGQEATTIEVPGPTPVFTVDAVLGHYTPSSHVWVRGGFDVELGPVQPHIAVEATVRPDWAFAPRIEVRGAWAKNQDFITRTRLGGLNPYVVPLAGAGWAEFWVESYLALRAGPSLRIPLPRRGRLTQSPHTLELSAVGDVAGFEGRIEAGFGFLARWRYARYSLDASLGYAPWLRRREGVPALAGFLLFGVDWSPLRKKK